MTRATLIAAAILIALSNAVVLVHAARNRSGARDSALVLTNRELSYYGDPDDSGVVLHLEWLVPRSMMFTTLLDRDEEPPPLIDDEKLVKLGFDVSVEPTDERAGSFYARQTPRTAFAALELDGPAWREWAESRRRFERERPKFPEEASSVRLATAAADVETEIRASTRLVIVDVDRDAADLRARHPDRDTVAIVPAVIGIEARGASTTSSKSAPRPARVQGVVRRLPSEIHVPKPFSDALRELGPAYDGSDEPRYRVRVEWGSLHEPWVAGVEGVEKQSAR